MNISISCFSCIQVNLEISSTVVFHHHELQRQIEQFGWFSLIHKQLEQQHAYKTVSEMYPAMFRTTSDVSCGLKCNGFSQKLPKLLLITLIAICCSIVYAWVTREHLVCIYRPEKWRDSKKTSQQLLEASIK